MPHLLSLRPEVSALKVAGGSSGSIRAFFFTKEHPDVFPVIKKIKQISTARSFHSVS